MKDGGFAGLLVVDLSIAGARSLKEKRAPLRSIKAKLKNAGYSVAEVAHHDAMRRSQLAISVVARGSNDVEQLLDEAMRICERIDVEPRAVQRSVLSLEDVS